MKMKSKKFIFIGVLFVVLVIISSAAANDKVQAEGANKIANDGSYGGGGGNWGGGGGNWGGGGGGGNWGGGGGNWGGGGGGGNWGGGGGGWGGGGRGRPCRWGCCGTNHYGGGGCRCCYTAQEAIAYLQYEAKN